jgi:hypothetical protein
VVICNRSRRGPIHPTIRRPFVILSAAKDLTVGALLTQFALCDRPQVGRSLVARAAWRQKLSVFSIEARNFARSFTVRRAFF